MREAIVVGCGHYGPMSLQMNSEDLRRCDDGELNVFVQFYSIWILNQFVCLMSAMSLQDPAYSSP